ncbi:hydrolase [Vibrio sp. T187]|uniref:C40 family peptidase n=1 Tax=Vibrio TaxID=662 RepID=UPI0010C9CC2A|nr:hydrolase [Vibrio sp. T187]
MKSFTTLGFTLLFSLLSGCSTNKGADMQKALRLSDVTLSNAEMKTNAAYYALYEQWQGVPYLYGGSSFNGIDCSAFVQIIVRDATQQLLPRTTEQQSRVGQSINYEYAKSGDLVFFKTSRTTNHVGVYLGNMQFLHASTSKGVIISRLDNPYWASVFWQFRRV